MASIRKNANSFARPKLSATQNIPRGVKATNMGLKKNFTPTPIYPSKAQSRINLNEEIKTKSLKKPAPIAGRKKSAGDTSSKFDGGAGAPPMKR